MTHVCYKSYELCMFVLSYTVCCQRFLPLSCSLTPSTPVSRESAVLQQREDEEASTSQDVHRELNPAAIHRLAPLSRTAKDCDLSNEGAITLEPMVCLCLHSFLHFHIPMTNSILLFIANIFLLCFSLLANWAAQ